MGYRALPAAQNPSYILTTSHFCEYGQSGIRLFAALLFLYGIFHVLVSRHDCHATTTMGLQSHQTKIQKPGLRLSSLLFQSRYHCPWSQVWCGSGRR